MKSPQHIAITGMGVLVAAFGTTFAQAQPAKLPPAYVVLEFNVKDPDGFRDYSQRAPATVAQHAGSSWCAPEIL